MRVLALLFFLALTPVVIILATISYGGVSTQAIKEELDESNLYKKIEFPPLTPEYIKTKAEKAVDDSALWVSGKTKTEPVINFRDIKDEFIASNPELQEALKEMEEMPTNEAPEEEFGQTEGANPHEFMKTLSKNDFSFPLKDSLSGLKFGHALISVLLPVLSVLMILCLLAIYLMSPDYKSKFRWIGITFLLSAIGGLIVFFVFQFIVGVVLKILVDNSNEVVGIFYPIIERVALLFLDKNKQFQTLFSFSAGVFGVVCFVSSFAFGKEVVNKPRPKKKST